MIRSRYWFFSILLVVAIFVVEYDLARRMSVKALTPPTLASEPSLRSRNSTQISETLKAEDSIFESSFVQEAQNISQRQSDPKLADEKIDHLARSMKSRDLKKLAFVIENKSEESDRRSMALELLARSQTQDAMNVLKDFVAHHRSANQQGEFESVLRAQAIEGIAAYPQKDLALSYLNSLSKEVDESFLKDRIVRSAESLKGPQKGQQQNDETALKPLVQ